MSHASLVRSLFDGPVDVAGDIHGEIDAMKDLMGHLGYREDGKPPEGRRLVFLGDLTDRGPENLAVVNLVKELVEGGKAACVLGNHDLNILLNRQREGNDWFFALDADARSRVQAFFQSLPLALERPGLRVVHACWQDDMIELARHSSDVVALYKQHARLIEEANAAGPTLDDVGKRLKAQNLNPVKLLTSGPERRASTPSLKGGRLRYEERADWCWTTPAWRWSFLAITRSRPTSPMFSDGRFALITAAATVPWSGPCLDSTADTGPGLPPSDSPSSRSSSMAARL